MKRFSIVNNGYSIEEVNQFIDVVIRRLEGLSSDNTKYLKEIEELKKQSSSNSSNVDFKVSRALIAAQETTDRMKALAKEEADLIVKEARDNASAIVQEALIKAQKIEQDYVELKNKYKVYKTKMESIAKAQLELCSDSDDDL